MKTMLFSQEITFKVDGTNLRLCVQVKCKGRTFIDELHKCRFCLVISQKLVNFSAILRQIHFAKD